MATEESTRASSSRARHEREVVAAHAAVLLGEGQAEQAHPAHLAHDLVRERVLLVELADLRGDDVVRELLDRAAEFLVARRGDGGRMGSLLLWVTAWWERARTVREGLGRPSWPAIHTLVAVRRPRSTPVSMPRPCSIQTRSSVARLPVALLAYGQPPRPPAEASTVVTPCWSAARVLARAWP